MRLWWIPMVYTVASIACGLVLPRIEQEYLAAYTVGAGVPVGGRLGNLGARWHRVLDRVRHGAVQRIAYSPRLVTWFARDPTMFHSLGVFFAAFTYSLATLARCACMASVLACGMMRATLVSRLGQTAPNT